MSRDCVSEPDSFCYACGELLKKHRCLFTPILNTCHLYFGCQVCEQDQAWAPHSCCTRCAKNLHAWVKGTRKSMPFCTPMIWREPEDPINDCYICITKIKGFSTKISSLAIRPVAHNDKLSVTKPPENFTHGDAAVEMEIDEVETSSKINYVPDINKEPHLISPEELNDRLRDFNLSKNTQNYLDQDCKNRASASRKYIRERPRAASVADDHYLQVTAQIHLESSLVVATGKLVSRSTVCRRLHKGGLYARRPAVCVRLKTHHRNQRFNWEGTDVSWSASQ
ncbi:hypothetical protein AVEN_235347-1 [Araneus ventricosus]|uniref:Transposase Tc1-like domain-containing protein n=1 Tax=Araneus ventricosus TaxID=182803 RepID=A0A4Y2A4N0_ARAVE|nr:hypothetical protein AVEN_235347-1 [Araneus ventricosus]